MPIQNYSSSRELPSVDFHHNQKAQDADLALSEKFVTKYLKEYAGFTVKEIKVIYSTMKNKEWDSVTIEKFCNTNFPGKKGVEYREKLIPVMTDLNTAYRKQLNHLLLGA